MFELSSEIIDENFLKDKLRRDSAGAFVSFEGWVRDHQEGKKVLRLEYEAYPALAMMEGNAILEEAAEKFKTQALACNHRTGRLEIGDTAVFVGAVSAHRPEAFAACRFIIDEIKKRVPIWKKEFYADGTSAWVMCKHEEHILLANN